MALLVLAPLAGAAVGNEFQDFSELDLEDLLNQVVVTASKHAQKMSESPAAATVITAEQIAASGARSIPELLYQVPGLDVLMVAPGDYNVSVRGTNSLAANKVLVLLDGQSVYADYYGVVHWEFLPVELPEIKAIEIIKGPGSAFYGANAFAGVINILTFSPQEFAGTQVTSGATDLGDLGFSAVNGGTSGSWGWRVSGGAREGWNWEAKRRDERMGRIFATGQYLISEDSRASVSAGHNHGDMMFVPGPTAPMWMDGSFDIVRADYNLGGLKFRWFWNRWNFFIEPKEFTTTESISNLDMHVHDFEVQHTLQPLDGHTLQWGGSYRYKKADWSQLPSTFTQDLYSAFAYDEWRASTKLLLSFGLRYDNHPLVGDHLAPRGGLVYKLGDRHALRFSYGTAYRDPSYLESYLFLEIPTGVGPVQVVRGDLGLESEEMHAAEIGYQGLVTDDLLVSVAAYQNSLEKLTTIGTVSTFPSPPAPFPGIPAEMAFQNVNSWDMWGGELALEATPSRWLSARAHWAYSWAEDADDGDQVTETPLHSAGLEFTLFPETTKSLILGCRFKSETYWSSSSLSGERVEGLGDERFLFDARLSVRSRESRTHAVLGVQNLFDRRFRDHPLAIEQRRLVFASVGMEF